MRQMDGEERRGNKGGFHIGRLLHRWDFGPPPPLQIHSTSLPLVRFSLNPLPPQCRCYMNRLPKREEKDAADDELSRGEEGEAAESPFQVGSDGGSGGVSYDDEQE